MPDRTYRGRVPAADKPLVWLRGEVKSPPFSRAARIEAGFLLRRLQRGEALALPHARPMPVIGPHCHELRVRDAGHRWRVVVRIDSDAVVIAEVFDKKSRSTPAGVIRSCQRRLREYDAVSTGGRG
jgi:phage-related protein